MGLICVEYFTVTSLGERLNIVLIQSCDKLKTKALDADEQSEQSRHDHEDADYAKGSWHAKRDGSTAPMRGGQGRRRYGDAALHTGCAFS